MTIEQLRAKRAQLLREADGLRQNGAFPTDEARSQFDTAMTEIETIDGQIRALEATPPAPPPPAAELATARETAITEERARVAGVTDLCRRHGMEDAFVQAQVSSGATVEAVRATVLEQLATRSDATRIEHRGGIQMGTDATDKFIRGMSNWLFVRSGLAGMIATHDGVDVRTIDPGEFRGLSLLDVAREALEHGGTRTRGMDRMALAGLALTHRSNFQTTSDFSTLLENVMHKVLRAAYATQSDTWSLFCGTASVMDFRTHNWYRLGALSSLDSLNEHGEFTNKSIPDAEKATFSADTKGNIIGVSRQVIVNDDLGAVMRLTEMLGRAGKLTIEKAVFTQLLLNSGLGPTQADSQAFFHSNRANVNGTAGAITVASIEADRAVMRSQLDPNSQDYLDLQPSVLLVPVGKRGDALTINDAQFDPADSKFQKPNTVRGLFRVVVDTPRITGTRRYLFADPATNPAILVSFLEGQREPVLETQDGWRSDGVEMKARLDFGVDFVDARTAVTNAGA